MTAPTKGFDRSATTVLVIAIVTAMLTGPGQTIGVSVFIDHFVEDLSLSRSQVSTAYLIGTLIGATALPTVGRLVDRFGVRRAQLVIAPLFGLALINMSFVNGMIWLAVGFIGIRLLGQGSLSLVATVTVSLRFVRNRGTAIGLYATGSGALMALVPVLLAVAINQVGWRAAWWIAAATVVTLLMPMAWFGLRSLPTGVAIHDATRRRSIDGPQLADEADDGSYDRGEAARTRSFWLLAVISGSAGMLGTALNFHQIDLLGEAGLSKTAAAALFIPQVIGSTLSGLVVGYLADRVGTRWLPAAGMALLVIAHWLAAIAEPGAIVFIYAVTLGAMGGAVRTTTATLLPSWFGTGHLGSIQGSLTLFGVGASALGPVALSLTQSRFGSYPPALLTISVLPAVAMVFALGPPSALRPIRLH